uniref:Uncharacterized protein n=1 Tax=Chromera velia CCMP2878 TaxID=1169474 RepID=A0A0G4FJJ8_9ALVE|eukprot:Cvel_17370.t1-p1 / transcript=Cvel_17370.t1 / gene=Cvel_17370 / organism=Chromera_velia_CCMP2878 / gene_product=hypothetical protein / transcript_product=hypothetical protein / location=Cvel_scaffold1380:36254-37834(+) / protein_length=527 / sequence_SO=supercontig / SO=protein_coding / is_pseudo=false
MSMKLSDPSFDPFFTEARQRELEAIKRGSCLWYHGTRLSIFLLSAWQHFFRNPTHSFLDSVSYRTLRVFEDGHRWPYAPNAQECVRRGLETVHDASELTKTIAETCNGEWVLGRDRPSQGKIRLDDHLGGISDSLLSVNLNIISKNVGESGWAIALLPQFGGFDRGGLGTWTLSYLDHILDLSVPQALGRNLTAIERNQTIDRLGVLLSLTLMRQDDWSVDSRFDAEKRSKDFNSTVDKVKSLYGNAEAEEVRRIFREIKRPEPLRNKTGVLLAVEIPRQQCEKWVYFSESYGGPERADPETNETSLGRTLEFYERRKGQEGHWETQARVVLESSLLNRVASPDSSPPSAIHKERNRHKDLLPAHSVSETETGSHVPSPSAKAVSSSDADFGSSRLASEGLMEEGDVHADPGLLVHPLGPVSADPAVRALLHLLIPKTYSLLLSPPRDKAAQQEGGGGGGGGGRGKGAAVLSRQGPVIPTSEQEGAEEKSPTGAAKGLLSSTVAQPEDRREKGPFLHRDDDSAIMYA